MSALTASIQGHMYLSTLGSVSKLNSAENGWGVAMNDVMRFTPVGVEVGPGKLALKVST